jgi:hypothetical protein
MVVQEQLLQLQVHLSHMLVEVVVDTIIQALQLQLGQVVQEVVVQEITELRMLQLLVSQVQPQQEEAVEEVAELTLA